ncbi:MAG: C25 family cysteine peptidase, partial [Thermoanaerobaculia bacterium]|nr:C25 family cysteine peptidase [Thermoanaerobaculia bacterium]
MTRNLLLLLLCAPLALPAQIWNGADTLYGNEWINHNKTYFKIKIAADGIYRIGYQTLADAGFPVNTVPAGDFRLYCNGRQAPIYTTTDAIFTATDFIEFFGERNRDALDRHLFESPEAENLNPWYSLFNDTTAYFLTWESAGQGLRFADMDNNVVNPPPKEAFCWSTAGNYYTNAFFKRQISAEVTYSWFNGEGFAAAPNANFQASFVPKKPFVPAPDATLTIRYACGLGPHEQRLSWNDSLRSSVSFSGFGIRQLQANVPAGWIKTTNTARLQSVLGGADRAAVAGIFLRYARMFDFENAATAEFTLDAGPDPKYLEIQAFSLAGGAPVLYDLSNGLRIETALESGLVKVLLPASLAERRIWLANPLNGIRSIATLQPVQFRDFSAEDASYIILSNKALFSDPTNNGADYVAEYAAYRRSAAGGGYKVSVIDVNELYDQFAWGVRFHPLAVRNFIQFIHKKWPDPRYLLLIGKGLDYNLYRTSNAQNLLADSLFFVPTYGAPGADQLLVMRDKKLSVPMLAIGRLAVIKPSEIRDYLEKVREHEQAYITAPQTLEGKAWMKRVIHNSGGLSGESGIIRQYTQEMASELAQNRVGADVYTYYKTSNDPIQLSSYEQMLDLLNGGVSLWMIFGHSSPNAVDFDIGAPNVYNNKGRYPLMMIMGCFSGLCSTPQKGIGEQFVLAPDRGAIAYFASVNYSFIDALRAYGQKYYERLGGADYGKSIGEVFNHTIADLQQTGYSALIALLHQNLLQGDPAIKLHFYPGPDYVIDPQTVKFDPNPASLEQPDLKLDFDVVN